MAAKDAADASASDRKGSRRCGAAWICMSVTTLAVFTYTAATLARYTPLYRPLECLEQLRGLGALRMDGQWINTTGTKTRRCTNPNNYPVFLSGRAPGKVYIQEADGSLTPVGTSEVPETTLPARGTALADSHMHISVPSAQATALLASPLLRIVTELKIRDVAELRFFGLAMHAGESKDVVCGFELRLATKKVGPITCAKTLEQLEISDVDAPPEMELVQMNPTSLAAAQTKKNVAFGLLLGLLGLLFLLSAALAARHCAAGRNQVRDVEPKVLEEKDQIVVQV